MRYKCLTCGSVGLQRLDNDPVCEGQLLAAAEPEDAAGRPPLRPGVLDPPGLHKSRVGGDGLALADGHVLEEHHPGQTRVDCLEVEVGADGGLDVPLVHLEVEHGGVVVDARPHQSEHLVDQLLPVVGLEAAHLGHNIVNLHRYWDVPTISVLHNNKICKYIYLNNK